MKEIIPQLKKNRSHENGKGLSWIGYLNYH